MDTKFIEDYQKQWLEWQKNFFNTCLESMPNGKVDLDLSGNFEKNLKFQEEAVKTYLEAQEKSTQMMMETQKQFWADYFELMRKRSGEKASAT